MCLLPAELFKCRLVRRRRRRGVGVNFKGGKGQSQKRFSNFFSFLAWRFFGMTLTTYPRRIWLNRYKGSFLKVKIVPFLHFRTFSKKLVSNFFSILAWTFPGMVLINYPKRVWLNHYKGHFSRSERSKFATFLQFWHLLSIYSKSV